MAPTEGLQGCWESVEGKGAAEEEGGQWGAGVLGIEGPGGLLTPGAAGGTEVRAQHSVNGCTQRILSKPHLDPNDIVSSVPWWKSGDNQRVGILAA